MLYGLTSTTKFKHSTMVVPASDAEDSEHRGRASCGRGDRVYRICSSYLLLIARKTEPAKTRFLNSVSPSYPLDPHCCSPIQPHLHQTRRADHRFRTFWTIAASKTHQIKAMSPSERFSSLLTDLHTPRSSSCTYRRRDLAVVRSHSDCNIQPKKQTSSSLRGV